MTKGPGRFEFWLIKLDDVLKSAAAESNPALFLYKNDARTKFFMLEGLSKLYAGLHDKKLFKKLQEEFKVAEDLIGQADYYDCFAKDFFADPEMPVTVRMFMEQRRDESFEKLNKVLRKRKWLTGKRTAKIRKKLKEANWKQPEKEIHLINAFYISSVNKINEFFASVGKQFTDLEMQVHSLRRKLRWLSIYPQALQGAVQLQAEEQQEESVKKYLTPDVVNSPFNKMPAVGTNEVFLVMEKDHFLSLSYIISALGKLKDKGLRIIAVEEAMEGTQFMSGENALHKAYELNHFEDDGLEQIMAEAKKLCDAYFEERNLEKMIL